MKKVIFSTVVMVCSVIMHSAFAEEIKSLPIVKTPSSKGGVKGVMAGCANPTAQIDLDINNVRARIMNGGDMWWDRGLAVARYEVPKIDPPGSKASVSSLFASAIWVGGVDGGGNLRIAAQTYRQNGNDFFPGPLDANASVDVGTCTAYDRFWKFNLSDLQNFWLQPTHSRSNTAAAIWEWPAIGSSYATGNNNISLTITEDLANFIDVDNNQQYDPSQGDYPAFNPGDKTTYPDQMIFWVYNDKGNIHTETSGDPIGLQVNATAFAFSTSDDINNMTFYRYELFNKGNYVLDSAYIAQWLDPDLGCAADDYIGCDTAAGLGICYNADADDQPCPNGYNKNIPMVGIDFFEGPVSNGKQLGMTGFYYYYNTTPSAQADPQNAVQFYGYMTGTWRDGTRFTQGGDAHLGSQNTSFVYPEAPNLKGNNPNTSQPYWSMCNLNTQPGDLRIVESSGPFKLLPGAKQKVTVGAVWVANVPYPCPSYDIILNADRKAQALFDANFKLLNGPDAPDMSIKEYDKELILAISNTNPSSNNYGENYMEFDNQIMPFVAVNPATPTKADSIKASYVFEGYQIFQLKSQSVGLSDLFKDDAITYARLVAQVDIKNGISQLVNYQKESYGVKPVLRVDGQDAGLQHTFRITSDMFATGNTDLINHKTYYYMVIAYGYNNYKQFSDADPTSQPAPYKPSRRNVKVYSAIPHIVTPQFGGTVLNSKFGDVPQITRVEGEGNGGNFLNLPPSTIDEIMAKGSAPRLTYDSLGGPINVKIYDPIKVPKNTFELYILDSTETTGLADGDSISKKSYWKIKNVTTGVEKYSEVDISKSNEQLFEDWGFSVQINQVAFPGTKKTITSGGSLVDIIQYAKTNGYIGWNLKVDNSANFWYGLAQVGTIDAEGETEQNWIRSGTYHKNNTSGVDNGWSDYNWAANYTDAIDKNQDFEKIVNGTWAPYALAAYTFPTSGTGAGELKDGILPGLNKASQLSHKLKDLFSFDIVFTNDKSKWTKSVVVETAPDPTIVGNTLRLQTRNHKSWSNYNDLNSDGSPKYDDNSTGVSWFPGYAINLETGERLNIVFGEDSWLKDNNGDDMLWNPTSITSNSLGEMKYGGRHYIYVLRTKYSESDVENLASDFSSSDANVLKLAYDEAIWVGVPMVLPGNVGATMRSAKDGIIPADLTLKIRVSKPYASSNFGKNDVQAGYPKYEFNMQKFAADTAVTDTAKSALDLVNVVPNPYYAYSNYETGQLDNKVKITNLPRRCTISIYSVDGTLIRQFKRDTDYPTSQDWDLKNNVNVPISSGLYLIHINADGLGKNKDQSAQKIIKWFGVMRQIDLNTF